MAGQTENQPGKQQGQKRKLIETVDVALIVAALIPGFLSNSNSTSRLPVKPTPTGTSTSQVASEATPTTESKPTQTIAVPTPTRRPAPTATSEPTPTATPFPTVTEQVSTPTPEAPKTVNVTAFIPPGNTTDNKVANEYAKNGTRVRIPIDIVTFNNQEFQVELLQYAFDATGSFVENGNSYQPADLQVGALVLENNQSNANIIEDPGLLLVAIENSDGQKKLNSASQENPPQAIIGRIVSIPNLTYQMPDGGKATGQAYALFVEDVEFKG